MKHSHCCPFGREGLEWENKRRFNPLAVGSASRFFSKEEEEEKEGAELENCKQNNCAHPGDC